MGGEFVKQSEGKGGCTLDFGERRLEQCLCHLQSHGIRCV